MSSKTTYLISAVFMSLIFFGYYPKWKIHGLESTISWDVSGYYWYLPSFFIYQDAKGQGFADSIMQQYTPTTTFYQAYQHESGHYVMKSSAGMAVQYLPFFAAAHVLAPALGYKADGFSPPYQLAISLGSLLVALLGLWWLRLVLRRFFDDKVVAWVILLIPFATNYLNMSVIDGALSHSWLFSLYAGLMWVCIRLYDRPSAGWALLAGALCGLATLTRPTEIISLLLPLLWVNEGHLVWRERLQFYKTHAGKIALAAAAFVLIAGLQPLYWKWATGHWLVYSYQDQGFSFLKPHLYRGLFSTYKGWLTYTPLMIFATAGIWQLWRQRFPSRLAVTLFCLLFIYITFSWDVWWYSGNPGQRAMVQCYALLAIPLAAWIQYLRSCKAWMQWSFGALCVLFSYYNIWGTVQAHTGGLLEESNMTDAYFFKVVGRWKVPVEWKRLLDHPEYYSGTPQNTTTLLSENYDAQSGEQYPEQSPGNRVLMLNEQYQESPVYELPALPEGTQWIRAEAWFRLTAKEWDVWHGGRMSLIFAKGPKWIKECTLRPHRILNDDQISRLHLDARLPKKDFDRVFLHFHNSNGNKTMFIDSLKVSAF